MKNNLITTPFWVLVFSLICSLGVAQVPQTLSYQGLLTDATGNPLSGSHTILFNFYNSATATSTTFSRGPLTVTTFQGLFTVILGNGQGSNNTGLPNLGSVQYYIGIVPDGSSELTPRVALTAVPYAFTASALDPNATVGGNQLNSPITNAAVTIPGTQVTGSITAATLPVSQLSGNLPGSQITGAIATATLPATNVTGLGSLATLSTVASAQITDGTIATADIADGAVTNTKVTSVDGAKITGTITNATFPVAQLTGNLPGSQITGSITTATIPAAQVTGTHTTAQIADGAVTNAKLASGIDATKVTTGTLPAAVLPNGQSGVPIGTIIAYGGATLQTGWLICDGSAVNRTFYSSLFSAISVNWGSGDNVNTFNLPDLRGYFLRGVNNQNTASVNLSIQVVGTGDPDAASRITNSWGSASGNNVGSYQLDTFQGHYHPMSSNLGGNFINGSTGVGAATTQLALGNGTPSGNLSFNNMANDGVNGVPRTSSESRPKNAYVMYIIKAQ